MSFGVSLVLGRPPDLHLGGIAELLKDR
jgi:hypothetical protein